ncbi:MAG TPA: response regulator [Opitutaceae bacterium]|jgi:CheY-like chemotaxis protein|nr:response regulator [Opitutaceae bacterium]
MPMEETTPSGSLPAAQQPPGGAAAKKKEPAQPAPNNLIQVNGTTLPESFAHDLNNQISIINGYSEVCLGYLGNGHKDEKLEKYLNAIHHATQQAAEFTRQLLALSSRKKSSAAYKGFPQGNESVFVVEDDAVLRDMLRTVLTQHGYKITLAGTGEQATKVFSASPKAFDLILLDLQLPDTTGLIVLNRIRQLRPAQKVIAVSGHIDAETTTVLKRLGVQDNLLKPYHLSDLGRAIRSVLARTA